VWYCHKIWNLNIFSKVCQKFNFHSSTTRINGTWHEALRTLTITSGWIILRMWNVSKIVEKIKTHILYFITFCRNSAAYEIMWKNMVQPDRAQMTIWRMRFACWITKATDTHSECVILTFSQQQLLGKRTSILQYTYFESFVNSANSLTTVETCSWFCFRNKSCVQTKSIIFLVVF
jgi:hypothetical protein